MPAATSAAVAISRPAWPGRSENTVLQGLLGERRRFTECAPACPVVTPKVLTETLRAMERDGTVTRTEYDQNPPRVEYELAGQGHKLPALLVLCRGWARDNLVET